MKRYGVHINGYTVSDSGEVSMWLARRSPTKQTYPGLLDNVVSSNTDTSEKGCGLKEQIVKTADDVWRLRRQQVVWLLVSASNTLWSKNVRRKRVSQQPSLRRLTL